MGLRGQFVEGVSCSQNGSSVAGIHNAQDCLLSRLIRTRCSDGPHSGFYMNCPRCSWSGTLRAGMMLMLGKLVF